MTVAGIILCGGKSSRMGTSKAWLRLHGETLLARTVRILSEVTSPVIVSAAAGQHLPPLPDQIRIVRDAEPDRGPLGGMSAAMRTLADHDAVFVAPCDCPYLSASTIRTIIDAMTEGSWAAAPVLDGVLQPLPAVYRTRFWPLVEVKAAAGQGPRWLLESLIVREVHGLDPAAFVNVNTPDDYAKLT